MKPVRVQPIVKSECILIDGMTLAMPRDGSCRYHKSEIADMMLTFGRKYVIEAIAGAKCYQSEQRLRKIFPVGKDILDCDTAYSILGNYSEGSSKWFERARLISNTDGGPSLEEILNKFNVDGDNIISDFREGLNSRNSFDDAEQYNDKIPNRVSPETVVDRAIVIAPKPRYACDISMSADAGHHVNIVAATTNADHISRDSAEHTMNIVTATTNADHIISHTDAEHAMNIVAATTNADHISRDSAEHTMNIVAATTNADHMSPFNFNAEHTINIVTTKNANHSHTHSNAEHHMNIIAATNADHMSPFNFNAEHLINIITAANSNQILPSNAEHHMIIVTAANSDHAYPNYKESMSVTEQDDPVQRK